MVIDDLIEGENSFRRLSENLPGIVYRVLIEDDNQMIFFNDMVQTMTGYNPEDLEKGTVCSIDPLILPEDKLNVINIVKDAIENNVPFEVEYRINTKNGELKWFFERGRPIRGDNGNPCYIDGVIFDITARKETEQKLKESEEKYRLITENVNDLIFVVNQNMNYEFVNEKAYLNIMGRTKEEMIGKSALSWVHPEDVEKSIEAFKNGFEKGEGRVEARFKNKKGIYHWFEVKGKTFTDHDGKKKALMISRDTTQPKKAQQKIVQEREKANLYLNLVEVILVALDRDGKITLINKKGHELLGYNEGELIGKNWFEVCLPPHDRERVYEYFKKLIAGEIELVKFYENPIQAKNGEEKLISWSTVLFKDGNITGLLSSGVDITERTITEQKLIESEASYKYLSNELEVILDHLPGVVVYKDTENNILRVNKYLADSHNLKKVEMENRSFFDFYPRDIAQAYWEDDLEVIYNKKPKMNIVEPWETDAGKRWVNTSKIPYIDVNGNVKGIIAIAFDITERMLVEQKLKESEEKFRKQNVFLSNILESLTHPFYVINAKEYKIILANSTASSEGLEHGQYCYSLTHRNTKPCEAPCECPLEIVKNTKKSCVVEHIHYDKEGNEKTYEIYGYPILDEEGNVVQMIEYALNVTDRKLAQQELKKSEENYRKLAHQWRTTFDAMSECVYLLDLKHNIIQCNKITLDFLGKKDYDEIIGHPCCEIIHGTNEPVEWCPMARMIESSHKESSIAQIGDGWCEISLDPVVNDEGTLIGAVHIIKDITERKKAEQKLKESEEKFRTIAERTNMGIIVLQNNQVKYANDAILNMFNYSQKEIVNWEIDDLTKIIHPEDFHFLEDYIESLLRGETNLKPYNSYRVFTKSGKVKWIDQFSKEIQYKGISAELVTIIDITEKKEAEQELIKLSNLKSELLRRTSHELKTPLVSIKGFSDLLLELHKDKLDDYVIRTISQIRMGCTRLESLVNDILKTAELESGTIELKKSKEDLSLLIKIGVNELEGLSELRNHTINLEIPDNLICSIEKEQIYNVITNILSNAIKFTPSNGKIEIKSEISNDFIIISIEDNGIGFSKEERNLIFKQFGKIERYGQGYDVISEGSGLGLYISKKIIEMHGGEIWVESEGKDKGSTFYFSLPRV